MSRKKQKTQHVTAEEVALPARDFLSTLPWELMAEILRMTSPKEVLALARCSRHFCNSLVLSEESKSIWENARKSCKPPLPNPTPNFTEPAYAAFIFDGGLCEQCGKFTENTYTSFSLRLRFCSGNECSPMWTKQNALSPDTSEGNIAVMHWLLCSEDEWIHRQDQNIYLYLGSKSYYRKPQFMQAAREYESFLGVVNGHANKQSRRQLYSVLHKEEEKKKKAIMDLSTGLVKWRTARAALAGSTRETNIRVIREIARREGWEVKDILDTPTYSAKLRHHNRILEVFTEQDFSVIKSGVEAEITKTIGKRSRSEEERAYAKRRELVALYYHRKKSVYSAGPNPVILPTLGVFREQTAIKTMQNTQRSKPDDVAKKLKDQSVMDMIDDSLSAWRDRATNGFLKILGIKKYSAISTKKLHPVDRATARFLCSKCLQHASDKRKVPPLDFRAACAHECSHLTKKQKSKAKWSPDQFELDHKAIKVTQELLSLLKISEEDRESLLVTNKTPDRILCKTCDGKIIMNFKAMQRHSHRHEDMKIEIVSTAQAKGLKFQPVHWGLCVELTSMAKSAPRKAELRKFGCRHCLQHETPVQHEPAVGRMEPKSEKAPWKKNDRAGRSPKLMTFNGMRCHVLQSHGISHIADEDIYRMEGESGGGQA